MVQGAAQAVEDAEALGAFLSSVFTREDVPSALHHIFRVRYRRASRMQVLSRAGGLSKREYKEGAAMSTADAIREVAANWGYSGAEKWELEKPREVLSEDEEIALLAGTTT
jgi:salicylate hydroxylase